MPLRSETLWYQPLCTIFYSVTNFCCRLMHLLLVYLVLHLKKLVRENHSFCLEKSGKWILQSSRNHVYVSTSWMHVPDRAVIVSTTGSSLLPAMTFMYCTPIADFYDTICSRTTTLYSTESLYIRLTMAPHGHERCCSPVMFQHITLTLHDILHCLSVMQRIEHMTPMITFNSIRGTGAMVGSVARGKIAITAL